MNWSVDYTKDAIKTLAKLDKTVRNRILKFINETLPKLENPREKGDALQGELNTYWRYKVGDYRLICKIIDNEITILVVEIGHRSKIYKSI